MFGEYYLVINKSSGLSILTKYDNQISYMPFFVDKKFANRVAESWNQKSNCLDFVVKKFNLGIFLKQEKDLQESGVQLFMYPATGD